MNWVELDGSEGEGGGQILRSALSLSMITGTPLRIQNIRAKRNKPGLLRQHLIAVTAAAEICGAEVTGAQLGSQSLSFVPGPIRGGDYRYAIGTAGSCTLVLQTVLPALWFADAPSVVHVTGGTHNPAAPPADFLMRSWQPLMHRMGVVMDIELLRHGFYPAGGGEIRARVTPIEKLLALNLDKRGDLVAQKARAVVAGVPADVGRRELERVAAQLGPVTQQLHACPNGEGPGNVLLVEIECAELTEIFTGFGERGLPAEIVADRVAAMARHYRDADSAVGEHLADQLLLPMALAGGGSFTTAILSSHLLSNMTVIQKFLPVSVGITGEAGTYRVCIT